MRHSIWSSFIIISLKKQLNWLNLKNDPEESKANVCKLFSGSCGKFDFFNRYKTIKCLGAFDDNIFKWGNK